jgi:type II secretory pathway component PulF
MVSAVALTYLLLAVLALYGCAVFAFLRYRLGRQEELLHVLTAAAEANAPLASALHAYLLDRPRGFLREVWVAAALLFLLPGYYWIWHRRHSFDARVHHLIVLIEEGVPLPDALRATGGVASRETLLAAAVGESTGNLAGALRALLHRRPNAVWLEAAPRALYPVVVLLAMSVIVSFLALFIMPKFDKIYRDFGLKLPWLTEQLFDGVRALGHLVWLGVAIAAGGFWLGIALYLSPTFGWYFPGIGWFVRMTTRGRLLQMLGVLLEAGKTVPDALTVLIGSGYFGQGVRRRLAAVRHQVEQGEPLAPALERHGLLPASMTALLQAAERARNLPWALSELGGHLNQRAAVLVGRISMVLFPLSVFLVGLLVGFVVVGMFLPLLKIMEAVSQ